MSSVKLSCDTLESFVGDVRPVWVEAAKDLGIGKIKWRCEGDAVAVRSFAGAGHGSFEYGVLLTFVKEGEAKIIADCCGKELSCLVISRKRRDFSKEKPNFYHGDFHNHSSSEHFHDLFIQKAESEIAGLLEFFKEEKLREVAVITDHATTTNNKMFYEGFKQYEKMRDSMEPIVYPGCENEIEYEEVDRFGRTHRRSGELLTINAPTFAVTKTYEEFFSFFKNTPFVIGAFAHPHVVGFSTAGVWDYRPRLNNSKAMRDMIKYIEVLGSPKKENMLYEYVYSEALDSGYRVSSWCNSDNHGPQSFAKYPGSTFIMAPERSREAITDALLGLRAYACESGNIKLTYKVNGLDAPADIPLTDKYHFEVNIEYFYDDPATRPIRCEVISNGGMAVKIIENENFENFEFDVESSDARWFYLRFVDSNTHRTFSAPVFCGRDVIPYVIDDLKPIDKKCFSIKDVKWGTDASMLLDDDTFTDWTSKDTSCELVIDMGEVRSVSALGNYAVSLKAIPGIKDLGVMLAHAEAVFPVDYVISTSLDGEIFEVAAEGLFRTFAGEEIVRFEKRDARYVKLTVKATAGKRLGRTAYAEIPMKIAELSLFEE